MEAWRQELYLQHYGIKGMRWGVRRFQNRDGSLTSSGRKRRETAYRNKLSAIMKNKNANPSDVERFKYRNHSLPYRAGKIATSVVAQTLISDVMTGNIHNYASMSKVELAGKLAKIAKKTATTLAISDTLAKTAALRYTDSGKKRKGVKNHLITTEDWIEGGVKIATKVIPVMSMVFRMNVSHVKAQRAKYEDDFNRWGGKILEEKVADVIWVSDDGKTAVIK